VQSTLLYQGGSDDLLGACDDASFADEAWGIDFEAELAIITGDVAMGTSADAALDRVRLMMLANDWSLRHLIPAELAKGFGFVQGKPATAFAPVAVTPDELAAAWRGGRVHLHVAITWNGQRVGGAHDCTRAGTVRRRLRVLNSSTLRKKACIRSASSRTTSMPSELASLKRSTFQ